MTQEAPIAEKPKNSRWLLYLALVIFAGLITTGIYLKKRRQPANVDKLKLPEKETKREKEVK